MGLESFKTEGPRTRTPSDHSSKNTQEKFKGRKSIHHDEFKDKWDMNIKDAQTDEEFIADWVKSGMDMEDMTHELHCLPHTIFQTIIDAVDSGTLEVSDLPDESRGYYKDKGQMYSGKTMREIVQNRINHDTLDSGSPDPKGYSETGLDAFKS